MQTKTYNVYNYGELSGKAKEKAIEWAQECLREDNFSYDDVKSEWAEKLESFGFTDIDIAYSGFWSQGDGASFTGKCEVVKFIKATKQSKYYAKLLYQAKKGNLDMSGESYRFTHHYSHENTV